MGAAGVPKKADLEASAERIYTWLQEGTNSNFRMLLNFTSLGGLNYGFMAADKVARAWIDEEGISAQDFKTISWARFVDAGPATEPLKKKPEVATGGLFD